MKRLGTILLACALILGMSQCKKENTNTNAGSEKVYIELKVENGQRADVTPSTGEYTYKNGDKLLVGYNNAYVGYLEYNATTNTFSNTLDITQSGAQPLHFYYLNGQEPTVTDNQCTFSISNQSAGLPVLAYATSRENFPSANGTYSARMRNQCALVEFNTTATDEAITIMGVNNQMTVNFNGNTLTPGNSGSVTLYNPGGDNTKRYAILLPTEEEETTVTVSATGYQDKEITIGAIVNNGFIHDVAIELEAAAVSHVFTVDAQGHTVQFSPGNLQYNTTTQEWRFAEHQWDYCQHTDSWQATAWETTGWIDFFGWGSWTTGGCSPLSYSYSTNYTMNSNDFRGGPLGGHNDWRTLTRSEWQYLFGTRTTAAGTAPTIGTTADARFAKALLFGTTRGVILFPDNYVHPSDVTVPTGINATGNTSWNGNQYNATDWGKMEAAGAIFLPFAGTRQDGAAQIQNVGIKSQYWSSTPKNNDQYSAYDTYIGETGMNFDYADRACGFSVRLVRNVQ